MDVYASGAACYAGGASCNGPFDYENIFSWVFDQTSYARGPDNNPLVASKKPYLKSSTKYLLILILAFSSGGFHNTEWTSKFLCSAKYK